MNYDYIKKSLERINIYLVKCREKPKYDKDTLSDSQLIDLYFISNDNSFPPDIQDLISEDNNFFECLIEYYHNRFTTLCNMGKEYNECIDIMNKPIIENVDKESEKYNVLVREFDTMQRKRCFLINEKGEPYSFDFTVETVGVLPVSYIVRRACEVAENMCSMYVNLDKSVPSEVTITSTDSRIIGYDFLFRGHDHTLGNLLQTWLVENHIEGNATPKITYAGYSIPHPLRDEMLLRVGVSDDEESTARNAVAAAAKGCVEMFKKLRLAWDKEQGIAPMQATPVAKASVAKAKSASIKPVAISAPAIYPEEKASIAEPKEETVAAPAAPAAEAAAAAASAAASASVAQVEDKSKPKKARSKVVLVD